MKVCSMSQTPEDTTSNCGSVEIDLTEALNMLSSENILSSGLAHKLFSRINCILRDEYSQIDWDDAWDSLDLVGANHGAAVPFLCSMIQDEGKCSTRDQYARVWAIRAIVKIGTDSEDVVSMLTGFLEDNNRNVRGEATAALRKCGQGHLIQRRWFN